MGIRVYKISSGAIDASGDALAYSEPIIGEIISVKVIYEGTHDMTVDLYEQNPYDPDDISDAIQHILDLAASGATPADDNITKYPRAYAEDITGTDLTYDGTRLIPVPFCVHGRIMLDVNSGTATETCTVFITVRTTR